MQYINKGLNLDPSFSWDCGSNYNNNNGSSSGGGSGETI